MSDCERVELATPFPIGSVNAYLLPGRVPTLVDCGLAYRDNAEQLAARIDEILGGRVELLVLTHAHVDHCGLAGWVQARYGCAVAVHAAERAFLEAYPEAHQELVARYRLPFVGAGMPEPLYDALAAEFLDTARYWTAAAPDRLVADGESLLAGRQVWRVRHLPGHSPGMIGLFGEDGLALTGDLVIAGLTPNAFFDNGRPESGLGLSHHLSSLRRLLLAAPRRVGPGHRGWIDHPLDAADDAVAAVEARLAAVLAALPVGRGTPPWRIVSEVFGEVPPSQAWLALADLFGALELLRRRGQAELSTRSGRVTARRLPLLG